MRYTDYYLDQYKSKLEIPTDYKMAQALGVSRQRISQYRAGVTLGDDVVEKISHALGIKPGVILVAIQAERAGEEATRQAWEWVYKKLGGAIAAGLLGAVLIGPSPSQASYVEPAVSPARLCIT